MPALRTPFRRTPRLFRYTPLAILIVAAALLPAAAVEAQDDPGEDPPAPAVTGLEPRAPIPAADFYGINFVAPFEP